MAEDDNKPGMGASGAVVGTGGFLVGAGGTALIANQMGKGSLPEDVKKFIDEDLAKQTETATKAYARKNKKPAEVSDKLTGKAKEAADKKYAEDLKKWEEGEKKYIEEAQKAAKEKALAKLEGAKKAIADAKKEYLKENKKPGQASERTVKNWENRKTKAVGNRKGEAATKAEEKFLEKSPHPNAKFEEWAKGEAKAIEEALTKVKGVRQFNSAVATKEAGTVSRSWVAFKNMSGLGKTGSVAVGLILGGIGASLIKGHRQATWQERVNADRNAAAEQQPSPSR